MINSNIEYEFRTTVIQSIHTLDDIVEIAKNIRGAKVYAVQEFIPTKTLDEMCHDSYNFVVKGEKDNE